MTALEVLLRQGFRVRTVAEQMTPDGQFPNVTQTPNPEVPASMDRAEALAESLHADLVLATDPDADRLGAMAPGRGRAFSVRQRQHDRRPADALQAGETGRAQMMPASRSSSRPW